MPKQESRESPTPARGDVVPQTLRAVKPATRGRKPVKWVRPLLALTIIFVASRVSYRLAGVQYDSTSLAWFWQYLDPDLLRNALTQSLIHLHSQPPLMNLYLGIVAKFFPGTETTVFWLSYAALGLSLAYGLYLTLAETGVGWKLAFVLAAAFTISPACVLYESWLFYAYPIAATLVWTAFFGARFLKTGSLRYGLSTMFAAAALALTWSLFHVLWLAAIVAFMLVARRRSWRTVLVATAAPLAMVCLWYGKNLVLFGAFTASTWTGMNFSKITNGMLSVEERRQLHDQNVISDASMIPPFARLEDYPSSLAQPAATGIPALDERMKPSGVPNYNNIAYVAISRQLGRDALNVVAARPVALARGLAISWITFFWPAQDYAFLSQNSGRIAAWARLWDIAANGRFVYHTGSPRLADNPWNFYLRYLANCGFFVLLAYLAFLAFGIALLVRRRWADPAGQALLFIWANVCLLAFVSNAVEVGENNRFRFVLDPLVLVMIGALVQSLPARLRRPPALPRRGADGRLPGTPGTTRTKR